MKVDVAAEAGVSAGFITAVLRGRKRPGPKVLAYLGLQAFESYRARRAGSQRPPVVSAQIPATPQT